MLIICLQTFIGNVFIMEMHLLIIWLQLETFPQRECIANYLTINNHSKRFYNGNTLIMIWLRILIGSVFTIGIHGERFNYKCSLETFSQREYIANYLTINFTIWMHCELFDYRYSLKMFSRREWFANNLIPDIHWIRFHTENALRTIYLTKHIH